MRFSTAQGIARRHGVVDVVLHHRAVLLLKGALGRRGTSLFANGAPPARDVDRDVRGLERGLQADHWQADGARVRRHHGLGRGRRTDGAARVAPAHISRRALVRASYCEKGGVGVLDVARLVVLAQRLPALRRIRRVGDHCLPEEVVFTVHNARRQSACTRELKNWQISLGGCCVFCTFPPGLAWA